MAKPVKTKKVPVKSTGSRGKPKPIAADAAAGRRVQRKLFGPDFLKEREKTATDFNKESRALSTDWVFGAVWARSGMPLRERSIVVISMLAALGKTAELKTHMGVALKHGFLTPAQLKEICLHAIAYCGLPAGGQVTRIAEEALAESGQLKKKA